MMIEVSAFAGQSVAVFGLGRSGISAAKALAAGGAEVWAWDDSADQRRRAAAAGVRLVDLYACDWSGLSSLVLSPGVPLTHPQPHGVVGLAKAADCEIIGDVELLARGMGNACYTAITGTNGKSTTTALIAHMLSGAGREVAVGGNLGVPVLDLEPLQAGNYVIEMSSYQIDLTVTPIWNVAVLLNITPDHIDRHRDFAGYAAVKRSLFQRRVHGGVAVICIDDAPCRGIYDSLVEDGEGCVIPVAVGRAVEGGVYVRAGVLYDTMTGGNAALLDLTGIASLPGVHNQQNAAAAFAAVRANGVDAAVAAACLGSFPGLAHRQERIAEIDGISFINDSKATNAASAACALACYDTIYWIAGGRSKFGGIAALAPYFPRIIHAFLIGEAAADFAETLGDDVAHSRCGTLESALEQAAAMARDRGAAGAVVLLSPACASFDQFADFEARGNAFRRLIEARDGGPIAVNGR